MRPEDFGKDDHRIMLRKSRRGAGEKFRGLDIKSVRHFESATHKPSIWETLFFVDGSASCNCFGWREYRVCWHTEGRRIPRFSHDVAKRVYAPSVADQAKAKRDEDDRSRAAKVASEKSEAREMTAAELNELIGQRVHWKVKDGSFGFDMGTLEKALDGKFTFNKFLPNYPANYAINAPHRIKAYLPSEVIVSKDTR